MPTDLHLSPRTLDEARARVAAQITERSGGTFQAVHRLDRFSRPESIIEELASDVTVVVAEAVLWQPRWDLSAIGALADRLGPDGWLIYLEPTLDLGWRERLARPLQRRDIASRGHAFTRDVPSDLRRAGLETTTVVRFEVGRRPSYVWGEARSLNRP